jgi:hypothetical protein
VAGVSARSNKLTEAGDRADDLVVDSDVAGFVTGATNGFACNAFDQIHSETDCDQPTADTHDTAIPPNPPEFRARTDRPHHRLRAWEPVDE